MKVGLNHGHGDPVGHTFPSACGVGVTVIRQEPHQDATDEEQYALLDEFTLPGAPACWWLIPGPPPSGDLTRPKHMAKLAASSGVPLAIEIANEMDLRWDGIQDITACPEVYADWIDALYVEIRTVNPNVLILAGGVSGPHQRGLDFLERSRARDWPADVIAAPHYYPREDWPRAAAPNGAVMVPQKSFGSREAEWAALKDVIGADRRIWIGEWGLHSAPRDVLLSTERWSDDDIAREATIDLQWFAAHGVEVAAWYQGYDADPSIYDPDNRLHCFGVFYGDGTEKPVAASFRQFTGL